MNLPLTEIFQINKNNKIMSTENKKDHANFQDDYRKSSNFSREAKDENLKVAGDGEVKMASEENMKESDKKKIADAMDKMQEKIEITPGGEQNDDKVKK